MVLKILYPSVGKLKYFKEKLLKRHKTRGADETYKDLGKEDNMGR